MGIMKFNCRTFERIVLVTKPDMDVMTASVCQIIKDYGATNNIPTNHFLPTDLLEHVLLVSIGGDGTMLGAMRSVLKHENAAVVGFNTGTLGFLTAEIPENIEKYLNDILHKNGFGLDRRMVAKATIYANGEPLTNKPKAINEFVITGGSVGDPITTEIFINEHFVSKQMGSGVLVSTATGSTAMSLSASGSIVSPATNIMQIIPLLAHTLTSRPIISTGRDTITVKTKLSDRISKIAVHADGRELISYDGDRDVEVKVVIEKCEADIRIWRPAGWNFFDVLAVKMKW